MYNNIVYLESLKIHKVDLTSFILTLGIKHIEQNSKILFNDKLKNKIKIVLPRDSNILRYNS